MKRPPGKASIDYPLARGGGPHQVIGQGCTQFESRGEGKKGQKTDLARSLGFERETVSSTKSNAALHLRRQSDPLVLSRAEG